MYSFAALLSHGPSGLYQLAGDWKSARIAKLCRLKQARLFRVDGTHVLRKKDFLAAAAHSMQFPDWFGANWDALADCLTDLSWAPADAYVIVLGGMERFAGHAPRDFRTALEILEEAAHFWSGRDVAFRVLIATDGHGALPVVKAL
jgi:RNAse (barnase) inhibitor barstar